MKCIISGANIKVLSRAIHFFSKIGDELFIDGDPSGLCMRTLNQNRTSYATINLSLNFFTDFECDSQNFVDNHCNISIKPCIKIFKSLHKIKSCDIQLDSRNSKLVFRFYCKSETIKTHSISILEYEKITQIVVPEKFKNSITAPSKLFSELLPNFHSSVEEITLNVNSMKMVISNHIFNEKEDKTTMRTKCVLTSREFNPYDVEADKEVSITFTLRDFKSIVNFSEQNRIPIEIDFEEAGRPILLKLNATSYTINFILSTLRPDNGENPIVVQNKAKKKNLNNIPVDKKRLKNNKNTTSKIDDENANLFNFSSVPISEFHSDSLSARDVNKNQPRENIESQSIMLEIMETLSNDSGKTSIHSKPETKSRSPISAMNTETNIRNSANILGTDEDDEYLGCIDDGNLINLAEDNPNNNQINCMDIQTQPIESEDIITVSDAIFTESNENMNETMEEKRKRTEFIFRRCFEPSFNVEDLPNYNVIAENSDEE